MSFAAVIKRAIPDDEHGAGDASVLKGDLKVTSTKELESTIAAIQEALAARKELDLELVAEQMEHIEGVLAKKTGVTLSLDHLELYQQYLNRFVPENLPEEVRTRHEKLLLGVQDRIKNHIQAGEARSNDVVGNEDDFTYLKIPMRRRRQMMVMLYCNLLTGPPLVITFLCLFWYIVPYSTYLFLLYGAWVTYDNMVRPMPAPKRVVQSWRQSGFYELFRDYFPIRTVLATQSTKKGKGTKPLGDASDGGAFDPSGHYLFTYHPHGVQSAGAFAFASVASGFDELFPGLTCSVQTLPLNFRFPITRENLIALGAGDASKNCLLKVLRDHPGSSAMLVTGGAKESLFAHPGNSQIVMKERAGFVKVAIIAGASLVPVWGFGENNLYENLAKKSSTVRKWQRRLQRIIGVAPLIMAGRGVFSYSAGLIPHRRPVTVVVGDPIPTGKPDANPSNERIAEVHKQYQEAVTKLFNTHKDIYDPKAEALEFV